MTTREPSTHRTHDAAWSFHLPCGRCGSTSEDMECVPASPERDELAANRIADAVLVRHATQADIARQVLILAEDPKILGMWADTCNPRPVTVADHFRALAEKLSRPTTTEETS